MYQFRSKFPVSRSPDAGSDTEESVAGGANSSRGDSFPSANYLSRLLQKNPPFAVEEQLKILATFKREQRKVARLVFGNVYVADTAVAVLKSVVYSDKIARMPKQERNSYEKEMRQAPPPLYTQLLQHRRSKEFHRCFIHPLPREYAPRIEELLPFIEEHFALSKQAFAGALKPTLSAKQGRKLLRDSRRHAYEAAELIHATGVSFMVLPTLLAELQSVAQECAALEVEKKNDTLAARCLALQETPHSLACRVYRAGLHVERSLEARNTLVASNLRAVVACAKGRPRRGVDIDDLVSEGVIGLMTAADFFDLSSGYHFLTLGMWHVLQQMYRAEANTGSTIRIPVNVLYTKENGKSQNVGKDGKTKAELANQAISIVSLEAELEGEVTGREMIQDPKSSVSPLEVIADREALREGLRELDEREKFVLDMRFGLTTGEDHTLQQIGDELGLTREMVRQIEKKALDKLREFMG